MSNLRLHCGSGHLRVVELRLPVGLERGVDGCGGVGAEEELLLGGGGGRSVRRKHKLLGRGGGGGLRCLLDLSLQVKLHVLKYRNASETKNAT